MMLTLFDTRFLNLDFRLIAKVHEESRERNLRVKYHNRSVKGAITKTIADTNLLTDSIDKINSMIELRQMQPIDEFAKVALQSYMINCKAIHVNDGYIAETELNNLAKYSYQIASIKMEEINLKIAELEAEKLLADAQIRLNIEMNETRAVMLHELKRQKELLTALQTH